MHQMLDYLVAHPEKGLLGYEMGLKTIVQYWRSFDQLEAFAKDKDDPHLQVWRDYWKRVGKSTRSGHLARDFLVRAGEYEAIYGNMPAYGLGKASRLVPVAEGRSARERLRSTAAQMSRRAPRRVSAARCGARFGCPPGWRRLRSRPVAEAAPPRSSHVASAHGIAPVRRVVLGDRRSRWPPGGAHGSRPSTARSTSTSPRASR